MSYVDDHMTLAAWGLTHGMSRQGAHDAAKRYGFPRREDGKVSKAVCDALYAARARPRVKSRKPTGEQPAAAGRLPGDEALSYHEIKRQTAAEELWRVRADNYKSKRELLVAADVEALLARRLAAARDAAMTMADRLTPMLAAESDPAKCYAAIEAEVRRMLRVASGVDEAEHGPVIETHPQEQQHEQANGS